MGRSAPHTIFGPPAQGDLFGGASAQPQYRPDPDRVRRRLERILAEIRAEEKMAWDFSQQVLYEKIFPDMTHFLPDEEGARYRADFEKEWERLKAA
jgi:hypothetical protein